MKMIQTIENHSKIDAYVSGLVSLSLLCDSCYELAIKNLLDGNIKRYIAYKKQHTAVKKRLSNVIREYFA